MKDYIIRIIAVLGFLVLSWLTERVIAFINSKIKNQKAAKYLSEFTYVVTGAVKATYQEYVEALKSADEFNLEAQKHALELAKKKIKEEMTTSTREYLEKNTDDIEALIETAIHSTLYDLKK